MSNVRTRFLRLEEALNGEILERTQEVHTVILAAVARKHHFQVGPPGTAKSLTVDRLQKRISGLTSDDYFRWLLTPYTTPEELFGGPDFLLLRERGIYKRITKGKMPVARFAFGDELFKANSAILNTMLTIMNERQFENMDDDPNVPLVSMFGASNELPAGDNLWALWDRLHFRHEIAPLAESTSFIKMLSVPMVEQPEPVVSLEDLYAAHAEVDAVQIHEDIFEAMVGLRHDLKKIAVEPTERRWNESLDIIRAEAWMNGRDVADVEDMRPLMHVLWTDIDHQRQVKRTVLELANPIDREASDLIDRLLELDVEVTELLNDAEDSKALAAGGVEKNGRLSKVDTQINKLRQAEIDSGRKSQFLDEAEVKYKNVLQRVAKEVFGLDPDEILNLKSK